jgi:hypothetical protein
MKSHKNTYWLYGTMAGKSNFYIAREMENPPLWYQLFLQRVNNKKVRFV